MPSFDIVSETDMHEVDNAIQSVTREMQQRYDFKESHSTIERDEKTLTILADDDYKLGQIQDMLKVHITRRKLDIKALDWGKKEKATGTKIRQEVKIKQGIEQDASKEIIKAIKAHKTKVQSSVRGDSIRVEGKKRDELQEIIDLVKNLDIDLPVQFINFRD